MKRTENRIMAELLFWFFVSFVVGALYGGVLVWEFMK